MLLSHLSFTLRLDIWKNKMNKRIVFVPVGGLANRMRSVASAIALAEDTASKIQVKWFCDWALNAPFCKLFQPIAEITEASFLDLLISDRPRRRNFRVPALFQKHMFRSCLYEEEMPKLMKTGFDFRQWAEDGGGYMASCYPFYIYPEGMVNRLFRPLPHITAEVDRRCSAFSGYAIGLHVRRTDNVASIEGSPLELFFDAADKELECHDDLCIYLATDSEEVKKQMRSRYGNRVICGENKADRNSVAGICDGIADMYALSRTAHVYGSFHSSFSELAAEVGNIPLTIVHK